MPYKPVGILNINISTNFTVHERLVNNHITLISH